MKNRTYATPFYILTAAVFLTGCAKTENMQPVSTTVAVTEKITQESSSSQPAVQLPMPESTAQETTVQETTVRDTSAQETTVSESAAGFSFRDVANRTFYYASGAGGWCTELFVAEDGSFRGSYHDSDMGDAGEAYPNGTYYWCNFDGGFTEAEKVNDYTYSVRVKSIGQEQPSGAEEIKDGVRYIASNPAGLYQAEEIYFYLPDAPVKELPEEFLNWARGSGGDISGDRLGFYGLYNVSTEDGFSSFVYESELEQLEREAAALEDKLLHEAVSQVDMSDLSGQIFKLWDDELNSIWGRLKEMLGEEEMRALTEEELAWIAYKDAEIAKIVEEYQGASLTGLLVNDKAAELTRERVYELTERYFQNR